MRNLDIRQFGRNGSYSLFLDESEFEAPQEAQPINTLIIQSRYERAPINTLVRVDTPSQLRTTFGKRDRAQERKGNYSMLIAELMLNQGIPLYILNLRDYDSSKTAELLSMSVKNDDANDAKEVVPFSSLYDKTTFWKLDREAFITQNSNNALNFAAFASNKLTIYVRKATELPAEFDRTIAEHKARFEDIEISHLPDSQLIEDTFVEVYVFNKDLTNNINTTNPALANYLDSAGAVVKSTTEDSLEALSKLPESGFLRKFVGCLSQEIRSIDGDSFYIENVVNGDAKNTGLALNVNEDLIQEYIDWDENTGPQPLSLAFNAMNIAISGSDITLTAIDELSYSGLIVANSSSESVDIVGYAGALATLYADTHTAANHVDNVASSTWNGDFVPDHAFVRADVAPIKDGASFLSREFYYFGNVFDFLASENKIVANDITTANIETVQFIGKHRTNPVLQSQDVVVDPNTNLVFPQDTSGNFLYPSTWPTNAGAQVTYSANVADDAPASGVAIQQPTLTATELEAINEAFGKFTDAYKVKVDKNIRGIHGVVALAGNDVTIPVKSPIDGSTINLETYDTTATVIVVRTPEARVTKYKGFSLNGVTLDDSQFYDGTSARAKEVLDMLNSDTFRNGLLATDKYQFKLITDGFETFIEPNAKHQIARLAKDSKRYVYMASMPFMKSFKKSINPMFRDSASEPYAPKYIVAGGNFSLPFTNTWSFVTGEENGDYATGYFSSNLQYSDGVANNELPGGPFGALLWTQNFTKNSRAPYDPVGGEQSGLLQIPGIVALTHEFAPSERDVLEKAGYNLFILSADDDIMIYNTSTAKQKPKSALSSIENTLLVHYSAFELDKIVKGAIFNKLRNTKELRDLKKLEADAFCETLVASNAIGRYLNICDLSNNTDTIRQNGFFVLDTELYATNGVKIAVHRTIVKVDSQEA